MSLFRSRDYPVGASDGSLFGVSDVDGKGGVVPRTTNLTPQKVDFSINGEFFLSRIKSYSSMSIKKGRHYSS